MMMVSWGIWQRRGLTTPGICDKVVNMQTYDPANDPILHEELGADIIDNTGVEVLGVLIDAREDRHESIRGMVLMIQALTDSSRRELYTQLGVHPL